MCIDILPSIFILFPSRFSKFSSRMLTSRCHLSSSSALPLSSVISSSLISTLISSSCAVNPNSWRPCILFPCILPPPSRGRQDHRAGWSDIMRWHRSLLAAGRHQSRHEVLCLYPPLLLLTRSLGSACTMRQVKPTIGTKSRATRRGTHRAISSMQCSMCHCLTRGSLSSIPSRATRTISTRRRMRRPGSCQRQRDLLLPQFLRVPLPPLPLRHAGVRPRHYRLAAGRRYLLAAMHLRHPCLLAPVSRRRHHQRVAILRLRAALFRRPRRLEAIRHCPCLLAPISHLRHCLHEATLRRPVA